MSMAGAYSSRLNLKPQPVAKARPSDSVPRSGATGTSRDSKALPNKPMRLRRTLSTTAAARRERGVAEILNKSLMEGCVCVYVSVCMCLCLCVCLSG